MNTLEFRLKDIREAGARLLTTSALTVHANGHVVWPVRGDENARLEIQIDDLLSHLTEYWKPIVLRQTYPLGLNPAHPGELNYRARRRWNDLPKRQVAAEDETVEAFLDCHDFSRCFAGYFDLPPLWIIRSGDKMLVETSVLTEVGFGGAIAGLTQLGELIAGRLSGAGGRWDALIAAWRSRDAGDGPTFLRWATGLEKEVAMSLVKDGLLRPPVSLADAANDDDEPRLAARMASALPPEQIRDILELVRGFDCIEAPALRILAKACGTRLEDVFANARPFEQGEGLADFVRAELSLAADEAVDIFAAVRKLGMDLHLRPVEPITLDALAVSGHRHGPSILLNTKAYKSNIGTHVARSGRARVTLAHELCHLLIDGNGTLSAVDVLGGLMPRDIEQRARAFGAQLLLPGQVAAKVWVELGQHRSRDGLEQTLDELCERYTVTRAVAAWKLEHGARAQNENLEAMLKSIVPTR